MSFTYSEYCKRMRTQGKRPISEEEFNLKKDELRETAQDAKDLSERAKESADSTNGGILKFEIMVNNDLVTTFDISSNGGFGRALAGGLLLGGAGTLAGAMTSKQKGKSIVRDDFSYTLVVKTNDLFYPAFVCDFDTKEMAYCIMSTFELLYKKK